MITRSTRIRVGALAAATALLLTGCASVPASSTSSSPTATAGAADVVHMSDAWVKAAASGMTGAFGTLTNDGDAPVTIVSATSSASASVELHETADDGSGDMRMREVEGGFVIPAGGTLALEPGGNHLMLMGLDAALSAGDEVTFTLEFADATTSSFTAPVKDYAGANEEYAPGDSGMDH